MPSQQDYSNVKNYTTEYVSGVSDAESTSQTLKSDIKIVFLFMFLLVIVGWILVPVTSAEANGKSFPIFSGT